MQKMEKTIIYLKKKKEEKNKFTRLEGWPFYPFFFFVLTDSR